MQTNIEEHARILMRNTNSLLRAKNREKEEKTAIKISNNNSTITREIQN